MIDSLLYYSVLNHTNSGLTFNGTSSGLKVCSYCGERIPIRDFDSHEVY